ncbi:MAG TPA: LON peptidase substrate-binding domain-containing protein [Candidatus Limnocylindrales bacterium]|nr:LON peptidase substrate-binding domain-containing protein [Candidatus Limnocylindrales bacterium]
MELPLFPLNTVLCPGIALPLHIFEDRYRELVRHCIDSGSPFGIVMIREGREVGTGAISFTAIGTVAEIRDAGRDDDGRYDLLVVGTRRFEIRRVLSGRRPYLVAEVDLLEEELGDPTAAQQLAMKATRRFVTYLQLLQARDGETAEEIDVRVEVETEDDDVGGAAPAPTARAEEPAGGEDAPRRRRVTIPDDPTVLSHLLSGIVQVEAPRRQALLEAASTEARLRELLALLDRETLLLGRRLRMFRPDARLLGSRRS